MTKAVAGGKSLNTHFRGSWMQVMMSQNQTRTKMTMMMVTNSRDNLADDNDNDDCNLDDDPEDACEEDEAGEDNASDGLVNAKVQNASSAVDSPAN